MKATLPDGTVADGRPAELAELIKLVGGNAVAAGKQATKATTPKKRPVAKKRRAIHPEDDRRGWAILHPGERHPEVLAEEALALAVLRNLQYGETAVIAKSMLASRAQRLRENISDLKFSFSALTLSEAAHLATRTTSAGKDEHGRQLVDVHAERKLS